VAGPIEIRPDGDPDEPALRGINNIRLRNRSGERASDYPPPMVVDEAVNADAN
jgi:hypothetical protein